MSSVTPVVAPGSVAAVASRPFEDSDRKMPHSGMTNPVTPGTIKFSDWEAFKLLDPGCCTTYFPCYPRFMPQPTCGKFDQSRQYLFVRDNGSVEVNTTVSFNDPCDPLCCRSVLPAPDNVSIYYFDQDPFRPYAIPCSLANCCAQGCKPFEVKPVVENVKSDKNCCCIKCGETEEIVMLPFENVPSCFGLCAKPNRVPPGCGTDCAHKLCCGPPAGAPVVVWPLPWTGWGGTWEAADKAAFAAALRAGMAVARARPVTNPQV